MREERHVSNRTNYYPPNWQKQADLAYDLIIYQALQEFWRLKIPQSHIENSVKVKIINAGIYMNINPETFLDQ